MKMIEVNNVSMGFRMSTEKIDNLKEMVVKKLRGSLRYEEFWALRDITFTLNKGDSLCIMGLNGSGKSTLLKVIAGVLKPTIGTNKVYGRVAPLIELGAGFDGELTAIENIFLNGELLGHRKAFMREKIDSIIEFAELEQFANVPIKNFSSGMTARLGFAIATCTQPDILILDEVLSVGDYKFQEKSLNRTKEIIANGATVLFVSHSPEQGMEICKKALWLESGKMKEMGDIKVVGEKYLGRSLKKELA